MSASNTSQASGAAASASSASSSPDAPAALSIRVDDLRGPEIAALLQAHLTSMFDHSPPESVHALDLAALRAPEITFWSAWMGDALAGCVALKDLGAGHAELKSMRTADAFMRRGVAAALMSHVLTQARLRRITRISLETGSMDYFALARSMYARFGFTECGPFGEYQLDPYSVFMTREIEAEADPSSLSAPPSSPSQLARSDSVGSSRRTARIDLLRSLQMCFPFLSRFLFEVELYPVLAVSRGVGQAVAKEIAHLLTQEHKRTETRRAEISAKLAHLKQIRSVHSAADQAALNHACLESMCSKDEDHHRSRLPPSPTEIDLARLQAVEAVVDAGGRLPPPDRISRFDKYLVTFISDLLLDRITVDATYGPNSVPRRDRPRADLSVLLPMIEAMMIADTQLWNVRCDWDWDDMNTLSNKLLRALMIGRARSSASATAKRLHMPTVRALGELIVWAVTVRRVLGEHSAMLDMLAVHIGDKDCKSARSTLEPGGQLGDSAELRQIRFNVVRACGQQWNGEVASATAEEDPAPNGIENLYWAKSLSYAPADMLCLLLSLSPRFVRRMRTLLSPHAPSARDPVPLHAFLEPCFRGAEGRAFLSRLLKHTAFRQELLRIPPPSIKQPVAAAVDPASLLLLFSSSSAAAPAVSPLTAALLFALVTRKERGLLINLLSLSPDYFRRVWPSLRDGRSNSPLHCVATEVRGRRNNIFALLWKIAIAAVEEAGSNAASSSSSSSSSLSPATLRALSDRNAAGVTLSSMLADPRNAELREIAHGLEDADDC